MNEIIKITNNIPIITPNLPGKTTSENASVDFSHSKVSCFWEINRFGLCISVDIPDCTNALLRVPFADNIAANDEMIWIYGRENDTKNIQFDKIETIETGDKFIWFKVKSGRYCFNLK